MRDVAPIPDSVNRGPRPHRFTKSQVRGIMRRWQANLPLTVAEASAYLGIPETTLRDRLRPIAPHSTVGRTHYYTPTDLERGAFGRATREVAS